jgi:hypothetical protein
MPHVLGVIIVAVFALIFFYVRYGGHGPEEELQTEQGEEASWPWINSASLSSIAVSAGLAAALLADGRIVYGGVSIAFLVVGIFARELLLRRHLGR